MTANDNDQNKRGSSPLVVRPRAVRTRRCGHGRRAVPGRSRPHRGGGGRPRVRTAACRPTSDRPPRPRTRRPGRRPAGSPHRGRSTTRLRAKRGSGRRRSAPPPAAGPRSRRGSRSWPCAGPGQPFGTGPDRPWRPRHDDRQRVRPGDHGPLSLQVILATVDDRDDVDLHDATARSGSKADSTSATRSAALTVVPGRPTRPSSSSSSANSPATHAVTASGPASAPAALRSPAERGCHHPLLVERASLRQQERRPPCGGDLGDRVLPGVTDHHRGRAQHRPWIVDPGAVRPVEEDPFPARGGVTRPSMSARSAPRPPVPFSTTTRRICSGWTRGGRVSADRADELGFGQVVTGCAPQVAGPLARVR